MILSWPSSLYLDFTPSFGSLSTSPTGLTNDQEEFGKIINSVDVNFGVSKVNGAQANAFFALKAYLSLKPYVILSVGLVLSTFILGIALRVFEIGMAGSSFDYIWNSFWVVILTMTTSKKQYL